MAQHNNMGENLAGIQGFAQQSSAVSVAKMKMGAGIGVLAKEGGIMVGFHEDEIGIGEPGLQVFPVPKVGGNHSFSFLCSLSRADIEAEGRPHAVVGKSKGVNEKRADLKRLQGKGSHFQAEERVLAKMYPGKKGNVAFVDMDRDVIFFQHPKGIMVNVIVVEVGEKDPVDLSQQTVQGFPAAAH